MRNLMRNLWMMGFLVLCTVASGIGQAKVDQPTVVELTQCERDKLAEAQRALDAVQDDIKVAHGFSFDKGYYQDGADVWHWRKFAFFRDSSSGEWYLIKTPQSYAWPNPKRVHPTPIKVKGK